MLIWPCSLPMGDNYGIAKIHWWNLKIYFSRTTGPISTKLGKGILGWRGFRFVYIESHTFFQREIITKCKNTFTKLKNLLFQNYWANFMIYIFKSIHWFELVSQVSDVAHGPLVVCFGFYLPLENFSLIWRRLWGLNSNAGFLIGPYL